jgi:hypothetical protein
MSKRTLAKLRKATPQEWVAAHSEAMLTVEMIWQLAAEQLDKEAGADRLGACAKASGQARKMLHLAKAFHAEADVLAAELGHLMPGGDDVVMPMFGGRG